MRSILLLLFIVRLTPFTIECFLQNASTNKILIKKKNLRTSFFIENRVNHLSLERTLVLSAEKSSNNVSKSRFMNKCIAALTLGCMYIFGIGSRPNNDPQIFYVPAASAAVVASPDVGLKEFLVKDGNEILRLTLPTSLPSSEDPEALGDIGRAVQQNIELVRLRFEQVGYSGKPIIWNSAVKNAVKARSLIDSSQMMKDITPDKRKEAMKLIEEGRRVLDGLVAACRSQDIESTVKLQEEASSIVFDIRLLSLPSGSLPYNVPAVYASLPQLRGRATVECTLVKPKGKFRLDDGTQTNEVKLTMIIDGYHSPVTSGNFIDLCLRKFYDGMPVTAQELIVKSGKPNGDKIDGFIDSTGKKRTIPLEIFYKKDKAPTYEYTSDDDMRATESFALPFQAYGALGMEHDDEDPNTASSQFWFLKWDQALVAPARNTLDGSRACFGYVVKNQDLIGQLSDGDKISSMKVVQGVENLYLKGKKVV